MTNFISVCSAWRNIDFPYIGSIQVHNKTVEEVKNEIHAELKQYLKYITVVVKLVNFKVSVLGEVNRPMQHDIFNDQFTIFEAISMSGDLTEYANRKRVTLVRQTEEGSKVVYLDLTDRNILNSPYYYLMPDDVIYVSPLAAKAFGLRTFSIGDLSTLLSVLLSSILLFNYLNPSE